MTEITPAMIYWILRLDGICRTATTLLFISGLATGIIFAMLTAMIVNFGRNPDEEEKGLIKKKPRSVLRFLPFLQSSCWRL